jgi:hypothetical protein
MSSAFTENVEFFRPIRQPHSFGTRGRRFKSCHSDQHLADKSESTATPWRGRGFVSGRRFRFSSMVVVVYTTW